MNHIAHYEKRDDAILIRGKIYITSSDENSIENRVLYHETIQ